MEQQPAVTVTIEPATAEQTETQSSEASPLATVAVAAAIGTAQEVGALTAQVEALTERVETVEATAETAASTADAALTVAVSAPTPTPEPEPEPEAEAEAVVSVEVDTPNASQDDTARIAPVNGAAPGKPRNLLTRIFLGS